MALIRDGTHRRRIGTCVIQSWVLTLLLLLLQMSDSYGGGSGGVHHGGGLGHPGRGVRGEGVSQAAFLLARSPHAVQVAVHSGEKSLPENSLLLLLHVWVAVPAVSGRGYCGGSHHRALVRCIGVDVRLQKAGVALETRGQVGGRYSGIVYSRVCVRRRGEAGEVFHGRRGSVRVRGRVYGNGNRGGTLGGIGERGAVGGYGGTNGGAHEGRLGGWGLGRHARG